MRNLILEKLKRAIKKAKIRGDINESWEVTEEEPS